MINGGKVILNENSINNLSIMSEYSLNKRDNSPKILNNIMAYPFNFIQNNKTKFKNKNPNFTESGYLQNPVYNSFLNNTNDYNTTISQVYNHENNYNFRPKISQNNEEEIFIQKIKDLIEQRERHKVQKIINQYYKQNYTDLMKKKVDSYPNGINLSISNCETQYPINYLNDEEFFNKLTIFLNELEMNKNKNKIINNNLDRSNTSYNLNKTNSKKKKKNYSFKKKYIDAPFEEERTYAQTYRYGNNYINKTSNNFYKKFNAQENNNLKRSKNKSNEFELETNENELNKSIDYKEDNSNSNINNDENYSNRYSTSTLNKFILKRNIGNILNENKNIFKKLPQYKIKNKNKLINEKSFKEYQFQEKFISKIKKFIGFLERCYVISINKFFHYFIEQLQQYNKSKLIENKDTINLLKRFQKLKKSKKKVNINKHHTKYLSLNSDLNSNSNNNTFNISNNISIIESYKNKSKLENNNVPSIYIPKNKKKLEISNSNLSTSRIYQKNLSNNKNKNFSINSSIIKSTRYTNNKLNLSNEDNSKKLLFSKKYNNALKNNNYYYCNIPKDKESFFLNYKKKINRSSKNIFKNNLSQSISSFFNKSKIDKFKDFENNFNDKIYSKEKPIIYVKPKAITINLKKDLKTKEKNIDDINDFNIKNFGNLSHRESNRNFDYIYKGKNFKNNNYYSNNYVNNSNNSTIIKNIKNFISPIKSQYIVLYKNNKNFPKLQDNEEEENNHKIIRNKKLIEEIIVKDIITSDRKLWITIKYLTSEISKEKYLKMKIKKRIINLNLKDTKNIFSNNDLKYLKINHIDSIELKPLLILVNANIEINNNKNRSKRKKVNNKKENYNKKNIKIINLLQNLEKKNILYLYRYFFDIIKNKRIVNESSLFHNKIFKKIKNNFNVNNLNDFNISNYFEKIDNENLYTNNTNKEENNSKNKINNIKNLCLKRNLFLDINMKRTISDDNICNNDYKKNKLNKSDLDEINDNSLNDIKKSFNISGTDNFPKKRNSFRLKITKYKILREKIEEKIEKKNTNDKLDILKEEKEIRKKNKIKFLLTNNFSYKNNCIRIMRNYFSIWKLNYKDKENKNNNNSKNDNNIIKDENSNILNDEIKTNEIKIKSTIIKEDSENNENKQENDINYKITINFDNEFADSFKNPLKFLNDTNNEISEINSNKDLKENIMEVDNSIKCDLEEIINNFRINLICYFLKNNNSQNFHENEK